MSAEEEMNAPTVDGVLFARMIESGRNNLQAHVQTVNDLNVFPIPDGDTGTNMLMTISGGAKACADGQQDLGLMTKQLAQGMLMSARGNSGVILSQIFAGIAQGLEGLSSADSMQLAHALQQGVKTSYRAVMEPTEGTILTVFRCAADHVAELAAKESMSPQALLQNFLEEASRTLERTPDMLPVLKRAGVVDSGGAGLIYIMEGMLDVLSGSAGSQSSAQAGEAPDVGDYLVHGNGQHVASAADSAGQELDFSLFTEDSVLEYGYCTEVLVRLQRAKVDVEAFPIETVTDYLQTIGNSIVAFKTGSVVKVHVHTKEPGKVLAFCQQFGEFLKIKIENMSLQHQNAAPDSAAHLFQEGYIPEIKDGSAQESADGEGAAGEDAQTAKVTDEAQEGTATVQQGAHVPSKPFGVVAVASGSGVQKLFRDRGADVVVDGGQCSNPSTEDLLTAVHQADAACVFILPNNGNVILAARQAAELCDDVDIRVIPSHSVGEGYAALGMLSYYSNDADEIAAELTDAMEGVITAEVSRCIRETPEAHLGDYIGIVNGDISCAAPSREDAAKALVESQLAQGFDVCLLIRGAGVPEAEATNVAAFARQTAPRTEVYEVDGEQPVYDYLVIFE